MAKIFISYRREDSLDVTDRLYERLTVEFGSEAVFRDMDTIPLGVDFRRHLAEAVSGCDVLLAVIGDRWLEAAKSEGAGSFRRRLDDPRDFVRIEIESALGRSIPVIPVLVGRASMPAEADLPDVLKDLSYRNAAEVRSGRDFHNHVTHLIQGLQRLFAVPQPQPPAAERTPSRADTVSGPSKGVSFGIDLGTTNSSIACRIGRQPAVVAQCKGMISTPSAVHFRPDGDVLVGQVALDKRFIDPDRTVTNAKRRMGEGEANWKIGNASYTPSDISAFILRYLMKSMAGFVGHPVERATITVPVAFSTAAREATLNGGQQAGLKEVLLMTEPEATVLSYLLSRDGEWLATDREEHHILVYDLGGGTFDLALVRYCRNKVRIVGQNGDDRLGGVDWDRCLVQWMAERMCARGEPDPRQLPRFESQMLSYAERFKLNLSESSSTRFEFVGKIYGSSKLIAVDEVISREEFAGITRHLVARTEELIMDLLQQHGLTWKGLSIVLGTGGSTHMPMIREMLARHSARRLHFFGPNENSVALGAAYHASAYRDATGKKTIDRPVFK